MDNAIMESKETMTQEEVLQLLETVAPDVVETPKATVERPYTLRKLKDEDLWPLLQLLRKLGFKELKNTYYEYKGKFKFNKNDYATEEEATVAYKKLREEVGVDITFEIAFFFLSKLYTHSYAIYDFFSSLAGVPADSIKQMEFGTLPLMIYDTFGEVKNTAFFRVLFKLL